jgi:hypothetical protein
MAIIFPGRSIGTFGLGWQGTDDSLYLFSQREEDYDTGRQKGQVPRQSKVNRETENPSGPDNKSQDFC